jgi:hypothetical protein
MDRHCPYINQNKTIVSKYGPGKVILKSESETLSISGDDVNIQQNREKVIYKDINQQSPIQDMRYEGKPRDIYGRRMTEKRSRWAKIGEEVFGMDVDDVCNRMETTNRI